jgi:hypothetical protein
MSLKQCVRCSLGVASLWLAGPAAQGQDTGTDARRWYEVEVVVFTHESLATQVSERPLADPTRLGWLPRLRTLQPASASLAFEFEPAVLVVTPDTPAAQLPGSSSSLLPSEPAPPLAAAEPVFGPMPAPMAARGFRLADSSRDPFIALDPRAALLAQDARLLETAAEHRVLWHSSWRQPMLPAIQAGSVLVKGGAPYGDRHELEGSLRFSDSGGRVQLDAHLWFSSFLAGFASEGTAWTLPALPPELALVEANPGAVDATQLGTWMSSGAWQLRDSRLLTSDTYHYLDNPAIGVIVQMRPYEVPPRDLPGTEEDF